MKKAGKAKKTRSRTELRSEYRFDYSQAKTNRFAGRASADGIAVVLDPDVAEVFRSGAAVNEVLRSIIRVWPVTRRSRTAVSRARARKPSKRPGSTKR